MNRQEEIEERPENKIIDWLASVAGGQLTIIKLSEGSVADLEVKLRGDYFGDAVVYLQIRRCEKEPKEKVYRAKIAEREFELKENFYLIFLYFDAIVQDIMEYVWLISSIAFSKIADIISLTKKRRVFGFEAPLNIRKKNKYSKYLVRKEDLAKALLKLLKK